MSNQPRPVTSEVARIIWSDPRRWWTTHDLFEASTLAESESQVSKAVYTLVQKGLLKKNKRVRIATDKPKVKGSSTFLNIVQWQGDQDVSPKDKSDPIVTDPVVPVFTDPFRDARKAAEDAASAAPRQNAIHGSHSYEDESPRIEATPREGFRFAVCSDGSAFLETADGHLELQKHEVQVLRAYLDCFPWTQEVEA